MTTATLTRAATRTEGSYGFRSVARMEWLKLRSVRSTAWVLLVFAAGMIGLAILVMAHQDWATMSPATGRPSTRPTTASPGSPSASSRSASWARSRSPPNSPPG